MSVKLRNWVEEPALPTSLTLMWTRGFSVVWLSDDDFYFRNLLIKVCVSLRSPVLAALMVTACMVGGPAARGRSVQSPRAESAPLGDSGCSDFRACSDFMLALKEEDKTLK